MAAPLVIELDVGGTKILSACELYGPGADAHALIEGARAGEPEATSALAAIGASLGAAVGSLVNVFDPDLRVGGGGFGAAAGDLLLRPALESARREAARPADESPRIVPAELRADAGLVGAGLVGSEALDGIR